MIYNKQRDWLLGASQSQINTSSMMSAIKAQMIAMREQMLANEAGLKGGNEKLRDYAHDRCEILSRQCARELFAKLGIDVSESEFESRFDELSAVLMQQCVEILAGDWRDDRIETAHSDHDAAMAAANEPPLDEKKTAP